MKQTLVKRAAAIRPDYSPLSGPPNPQVEAARAALMEYGRQLLHNPPPVVPPAQSGAILTTFSGPDAPTWDADEVEAWYAVAVDISRAACAGAGRWWSRRWERKESKHVE